MFTKTGKNDWVDYAVFILAFLAGMAAGFTISTIFLEGILVLLISLVTGTACGIWAIQGEPEDVFKKEVARNSKINKDQVKTDV